MPGAGVLTCFTSTQVHSVSNACVHNVVVFAAPLLVQMLDAGALTLSTTPSPSAALHKQSETGQFDPHTSQHVVQMYTGTAAYTSLCNGLLPTHHAGQQQQEQQLTQAPNGSMDWTFQSFLMNEASEQEQQQQQQPPGAALHQMPMLAAQPLIQRPPAAANMLSVKPPAAADSGAFDGAAASSPATTVTVASAGVPTTLEVTCGQVFGLYDVLRCASCCITSLLQPPADTRSACPDWAGAGAHCCPPTLRLCIV